MELEVFAHFKVFLEQWEKCRKRDLVWMQFFLLRILEKKIAFVAPPPMFEIYVELVILLLTGKITVFTGAVLKDVSWHDWPCGPHRLMIGTVGPLAQNVSARPSGSSRMGC